MPTEPAPEQNEGFEIAPYFVAENEQPSEQFMTRREFREHYLPFPVLEIGAAGMALSITEAIPIKGLPSLAVSIGSTAFSYFGLRELGYQFARYLNR